MTRKQMKTYIYGDPNAKKESIDNDELNKEY